MFILELLGVVQVQDLGTEHLFRLFVLIKYVHPEILFMKCSSSLWNPNKTIWKKMFQRPGEKTPSVYHPY